MNLELKEMYDIKNIIKKRARYQKVMLIYDDSVSEIETRDIYELIREDCIYNQSSVSILDKNELMNGYRLIIYYMRGENFLNLGIQTNEFVNVYIPNDKNILPFFIDDNFELSDKNDFLILNSIELDNAFLTSIYFNRVFNYLNNVIYNMEKLNIYDSIDMDKILQDPINVLKNERINTKFIDLMIIKQTGLYIELLPLLDFVLLVGFELFAKSIREKTFSMIDVYKVAQNDDKKINKYFDIMSNYSMLEVLNLNFHCVSNFIQTNKSYVLKLLIDNYTYEVVDNVIGCIKEFAKEDDGILGSMYFYNIFST
ncbi:MAG: hypothetical protein IKA36_03105 [Clostridia bacterium]|nr:hypothetical protein [Clostridia bacterium]